MKQKETIYKQEKPEREYKGESKKAMWPFTNDRTQKGVSIVLIIGGLLTLFFPTPSIPNGFMAGVVLAVVGAIYLLDLR